MCDVKSAVIGKFFGTALFMSPSSLKTADWVQISLAWHQDIRHKASHKMWRNWNPFDFLVDMFTYSGIRKSYPECIQIVNCAAFTWLSLICLRPQATTSVFQQVLDWICPNCRQIFSSPRQLSHLSLRILSHQQSISAPEKFGAALQEALRAIFPERRSE